MKTGFFGDLHLEAGMSLGHGEFGKGSRFHDQELVLERIAETFESEGVRVACCLGDVFQSPTPSPWSVLAFQRLITRLVDADISVVVILGNHDLKSAALPTALQIFATDDLVSVSLSPQLIPIGDTVYATLPWAPLSVLVAEKGRTEELRRDAIDLLAQSLQYLRLQCASEYPDSTPMLLGHWAVSGSTLPSGRGVEEMLREPIIPWGDIDVLGWKVAAFGHIHQPQTIGETATPLFYVGSPAVCNLGEVGTPHGVWIYDDEPDALKFVAIADRPFIDRTVEAVELDGEVVLTAEETTPSFADAVVRVRYRSNGLHVDEAKMRLELLEMGAHKVFIKEIEKQTASRARIETIDESVTVEQALSIWITSQGFEGPDQDVRQFLDALTETHLRYVTELAA